MEPFQHSNLSWLHRKVFQDQGSILGRIFICCTPLLRGAFANDTVIITNHSSQPKATKEPSSWSRQDLQMDLGLEQIV